MTPAPSVFGARHEVARALQPPFFMAAASAGLTIVLILALLNAPGVCQIARSSPTQSP